MNYEFKEITDKNLYKDFEENYHDFDTFFQSWEWSEFELSRGKKLERIGIFKNGNLVGLMSVVFISAKRGKYLHVRNGPLLNWNDAELINETINYLKKSAKNKCCSHVRISPLIAENQENKRFMKGMGLKPSQVHDVDAEVCWVLDLNQTDDELLSKMRTNTRYHINRKRKEQIEIEKSPEAKDIEKFWPIFSDTVKRQKWNAYSKDYLMKEFENFAVEGKAMWYFVKCDGVYVAGVFVVMHKGVAYRHHAASLSEYRKVAAPYLIEWAVIQDLKERGFTKYNMMGIARTDNLKDPWAGLTFFKKGFGGNIEEHLHAHDLPVSNRYKFIKIYELIQRKLKGF